MVVQLKIRLSVLQNKKYMQRPAPNSKETSLIVYGNTVSAIASLCA